MLVMDMKHPLVTLSEALAAHQGVTHFAISMRAKGKGDFFKRLMRPGADCRTTACTKSGSSFSTSGSKAVLGQTATTDAVTGGLGSGKEHGDVRSDIKGADAKALAAVLNRDLIRIWVQMEFGPQKVYPRLRIEDPEQEDLKALADALGPLIDRGLEVEQATMLQRFGLPEPKAGAKLLRPQSAGAPVTDPMGAKSEIKRETGVIKRVEADPAPTTALQAEGPPAGKSGAAADLDALAGQLATEATPAVGVMLTKIEAMLESAGSLAEFRQMLLEGFDDVDSSALAAVVGLAMTGANLAGRVAIEEDGA